MESEKKIQNDILLKVSKSKLVRLFRNNTGMAWTGEIISRAAGMMTIKNPRPFHGGLVKGSSDLIGYKIVTVTEDMVGQELAVFSAVEVKAAQGRTTPEQEQFLRTIREAGGIAEVVRSPEEAARLFGI